MAASLSADRSRAQHLPALWCKLLPGSRFRALCWKGRCFDETLVVRPAGHVAIMLSFRLLMRARCVGMFPWWQLGA